MSESCFIRSRFEIIEAVPAIFLLPFEACLLAKHWALLLASTIYIYYCQDKLVEDEGAFLPTDIPVLNLEGLILGFV